MPSLTATFVLGLIQICDDRITVAVFAPLIEKPTLQVAVVNKTFGAIVLVRLRGIRRLCFASRPD